MLDWRMPLAFAVLSVATAGAAWADEALLQKHNCFACHGIDKRKYGPNLVEVATKYRGVAKAEETLAKKVRAGGSGVWGQDVMPPQPKVPVADARKLAKFILALEPGNKP
jgi:cytochrome c